MERLQKILSAAGVASRRAAEKLIVEGRVSVNGATVTELGSRADPQVDDIRVDGRRIAKPRRRYIALYKPRGYVSTRSDPEHRPTVIELVGGEDYLYPVGRLDYDSEGLLLLTNDGELAERLTHPRYGVEREYEARVRGVPEPNDIRRLEQGVIVEGRRTAPAKVHLVETGRGARGDQAVLSVVLHEGRTRQVRNMCDAVGHPVVRLRRVRVGPILIEGLKPGTFRELSAAEVAALQRAAGMERPAKKTMPQHAAPAERRGEAGGHGGPPLHRRGRAPSRPDNLAHPARKRR
ncbi:MAG: pseudouridine synthase [Bacteroidales bacterium]